jgi:hypothetical protein
MNGQCDNFGCNPPDNPCPECKDQFDKLENLRVEKPKGEHIAFESPDPEKGLEIQAECTHNGAERADASFKDGGCPICLKKVIDRQAKQLDYQIEVLREAQKENKEQAERLAAKDEALRTAGCEPRIQS